MTIESLPSLPASIIDVPEPKGFEAAFVYNFFVKDELVNGSGAAPASVAPKSGESISAEFFDDINVRHRVPRMVKMTFTPVKVLAPTNASQVAQLGTELPRSAPPKSNGLAYESISIAANLDKLISEEEFANFGFTGIGFQDTAIDGRLYHLASGSITSRINATQNFSFAVKNKQVPQTLGQAAGYLNAATPETVSGEVSAAVLSQIEASTAAYVSEAGKKIVNDTFKQLKDVSVRMQVNNKHLHRILSHVVHDTASIYGDELSPLLLQAQGISSAAKAAASTDTISMDDYETKLRFVDLSLRDPKVPAQLSSKIVGYVIDKYEHLTDGSSPIARKPIVIESSNATAAVDLAVKYGASYSYTVRAVAAVEFPARPNDGSNRLFTATALVMSRPTSRRFVKCAETLAPPPPADFNVAWDYGRGHPRLTWALPPNSQRDVKKFQVFKRKTIAEPFQLVRMFDFNDSSPALPDIETPDPRLVETSQHPVLLWIDKDFAQGDKRIYAVCSIDAHGMSSGYSMQFEVSFDRLSNKLVKKAISPSGAPKPYPNAFLAQDLFIDSMRDSGHSMLTVAFTPEVIELRDAKNDDVHFMSTDKNGGTYKLQLVNIDLTQQADVNIVVRDLRKAKK